MKPELKIVLRKAEQKDIEFLWYLRNRRDVFKYAKKNPGPISWEEHLNWLMPVLLGQSNKALFIIELKQKPIGQIFGLGGGFHLHGLLRFLNSAEARPL